MSCFHWLDLQAKSVCCLVVKQPSEKEQNVPILEAVLRYHGFIKNIPEELEEAATIDGCGSIRLFISIVLPLMRTIIVTVAVINVMGTWNDFLLPSLIINKQGLQTLPLKTYLFFGQFAKRWDLASAGLVMCMAPIIIFYLFSQKYIVKGITEGAIK